MRIILASQSPRRRELLERMGITKFDIIPAKGEEVADPALSPQALVEGLSRQKADEVAAQFPDALVIAADTVVAIDGKVLGKPSSPEHAIEMLTNLSGRAHHVYTGFTVRCGQTVVTAHEDTTVNFRQLTAQEISSYVATGEPMDKAGAYGIQGFGCVLVNGIQGDYYNVVGLPVCRLFQVLEQFGVNGLTGEGM